MEKKKEKEKDSSPISKALVKFSFLTLRKKKIQTHPKNEVYSQDGYIRVCEEIQTRIRTLLDTI